MNPRVFNVSMATGVAAIGAGVAIEFSVPTAMIIVGMLVVLLTIVVARIG